MKIKIQSIKSPPGLMSVKDVARRLGISATSVRRHKINGDLPYRKVGWLVKFEPVDVEIFAARIGGKRAASLETRCVESALEVLGDDVARLLGALDAGYEADLAAEKSCLRGRPIPSKCGGKSQWCKP